MLDTLKIDQNAIHLENAIREGILQRGEAKGLVVLEGLYHLKFQAETWMTFNQIYRLLRGNFNCSRRLVYEGLQSKLIFQRRKAKSVAHQKGARPYLYRIPHPLQLKVEFAPKGEVTPSDQLGKKDLRSVTNYRMGLHRELYIRKWTENGFKGFKMYRGLQADRLGVSTRTIRSYDEKLGFSHVANYIEERLYWEDWNKLPRFKNKFDAEGKKLPSRKWLKVVDWTTGFEQTMPYVAYLAYSGLKDKYAVYQMERDANTYYPYQRPDANKFEGGDYSLDFYYEQQEALDNAGFYREDNKWIFQRE